MAKLNISWAQFAMCNSNPTKDFEDMCRRLFKAEFLKGRERPHADHNNTGIEVLPILEAKREDGQLRKRISFQCKYVDKPSYAYSAFQKSAKKTAERYEGELDLVYLFCNKTLTTTARGYKAIVKLHADAGIETRPISGDEVLDMVAEYQDIAEYFFQARVVADVGTMAVGNKEIDLESLNERCKNEITSITQHYREGNAHNNRTIAAKSNLNRKISRIVSKRIISLDEAHFLGREESLVELHEKLNSRGQCLVSGMGGIGKSEFIRKYVERFDRDYWKIIWLSYEDSLIQTLVSDNKLHIKGIDRISYSYETDLQYALRKLRLLQEEADCNMLVILDNFDVDGDELMQAFLDGNYTLIITSRIKHNLKRMIADEICLGELSDTEIMQLFYTSYIDAGGILSRKEILSDDNVIEIVFQCLMKHTYFTIRAASILATERINGSLIKPEQLLDSLKKNAHKYTETLDIHARMINNLSILFRLTSLTDDEMYFLKNLALVSIAGISVHDICALSGFSQRKGYAHTIDVLIKRHWILIDKEHDYVSLHVLVRTLILNSIDYTETTFDIFAKSLWNLYSVGRLTNTGSEKHKNYLIANSAESVFPKTHYQYYYLKKAKIFLESDSRVNEVIKDLEGIEYPNEIERLQILCRCAQLYYGLGKFEHSYSLIVNYYNDMKDNCVDEWRDDYATRYIDLAQRAAEVFRAFGDYDNALEALQIAEKASSRYHNSILSEGFTKGWIYYHIARTYNELGDVCTSKDYLDKSICCFENKWPHGLQFSLELKGELLGELGQYEKAFKFFSDAERSHKINLPVNHLDYSKFYIRLGDLYLRQGKYEEAKNEYECAVTIIKLYESEYLLKLASNRIKSALNNMRPKVFEYIP